MLIPIYQELGSWKDLPNVYEIALESTEDPHERRDLLLALAAVHEDKLDDVESSFFNFVQAVSENPSDVALHPKLRQPRGTFGQLGELRPRPSRTRSITSRATSTGSRFCSRSATPIATAWVPTNPR
jgi:hypothetical protein